MLPDSDRWDIEDQARVARNPEENRMEATDSVDQQEVGSSRKSIHRGFDSRELAVGKVRGNVREFDPSADAGSLHGLEILDVHRYRRGIHAVVTIRYIDPRDVTDRRGIVAFLDLRGETPLLLPQLVKESNGPQRIEDHRRRDSVPRDSDSFFR